MTHKTIEPGILYFGTPVILISTVNEDGSYNLAPMSSAFWLGWRCMLGLGSVSKTTQNMKRTYECVLNLPSVDNVASVNNLALTTGSNPVPGGKVQRGYRFVKDKFETADMTAVSSEIVDAPRVWECPVQLEAVVKTVHGLGEDDPARQGQVNIFEVLIKRVHVDEAILMDGECDRIDPDKWRPIIMSFQKFYGLESRQLHDSALAEIPEHLYKGPDIEQVKST